MCVFTYLNYICIFHIYLSICLSVYLSDTYISYIIINLKEILNDSEWYEWDLAQKSVNWTYDKMMSYVNIDRRKFRSQTSDKMDRWKSRGGKSQGGEEQKWEDQRKTEKKEDAGARKSWKVAILCVSPMICGSGGSKSRLAKAAGAEPGGQMRDEIARPLWREARFQIKMHKAPQLRASDHFWKLRCSKSAPRCGEKHMSKSKCTEHTMFGPRLEVVMSKKCASLWREAHFQVKSVKNWRSRTTFGSCDVQKVYAVVAWSTCPSQNVQSTPFPTTFGSWDVEKVRAVVARSTFGSQKCKKMVVLSLFWRSDVEKVLTN